MPDGGTAAGAPPRRRGCLGRVSCADVSLAPPAAPSSRRSPRTTGRRRADPSDDPTRRAGPPRAGVAVCSHGWPCAAWSVVVPAKRLAVAKTRLRPLTDAPAGGSPRRRCVLALLADTVTAALGLPGRRRRRSWSPTTPAAAGPWSGSWGRARCADEPDRGLQPGPGARRAALRAASAVAALSSDLPALRAGGARRGADAAAGRRPALLRRRRRRHRARRCSTARATATCARSVRPGLGAPPTGPAARSRSTGAWPGLRARRRHRRRPACRGRRWAPAAHHGAAGPTAAGGP